MSFRGFVKAGLALFVVGVLFGCGSDKTGPSQGGVVSKRLERAIVFSGGGFQTAIFLGMLEGALEKNWQPDLVIGTCGSNLAVAIINAIPDTVARRAFVESRAFHALLRSAELNSIDALTLASSIAALAQRASAERAGRPVPAIYPDPFSMTLMRLPEALSMAALDRAFTTRPIRSLMVASRLLYPRESAGRPRPGAGEKLFQETYFTDAETARLTVGFPSPIALAYPGSRVLHETRTVTDATLAQGARAGITDPSYINPVQIGGHYYLAGSIDLYPLELAQAIAQSVMTTYSAPFSQIEEDMIQTTYGYSNNERLSRVHRMEADYWIDFSDSDEVYRTAGFNPQINLFGAQSGVPASYDEFKRRIGVQWEYGKRNAIGALNRPVRNDKSHVRFRRTGGST